jgi:hypothetical protein
VALRKSGKESKYDDDQDAGPKSSSKRRKEVGLESVLSKEVDAVYRPQVQIDLRSCCLLAVACRAPLSDR